MRFVLTLNIFIKKMALGFLGGAVVKNLPANAGTRVQPLVREDPTCRGATKPVRHNYWGSALEPVLRNKRSHRNEE